jgi:hypothetical protein
VKVNQFFAVLHGDKSDGADPLMTLKGVNQIESLKGLLPENPAAVICGTGRRHRHVAATLGLTMTRSTLLLGDATSLDMIDGQPTIVFADGNHCAYDAYTGIADMAPAIPAFLESLPDGAVLCTGRPFAKSLGIEAAKSGSVIEITIDENGEIGWSILDQLGETEV